MSMMGFWSYVRADDDMDVGRVTQLGRDVTAHYEGLTAEPIEIFLDVDGIRWGDDWQAKIDDTLSNVAFFIPVITPRFFKSAACRQELTFFSTRAERLGITSLIMPILYIDVPELKEESPTDNLMSIIKKYHWTPWTDLRWEDRGNGQYRKAVNGLAQELMKRVEHLNQPEVVAAIEAAAVKDAEEDGAPGSLDRLALMEEAFPRWALTMEQITAEIQEIGRIMSQGTTDMGKGKASGKAFAARLTVARRVAISLESPAVKIEELGQDFAMSLGEIDEGLRVFFRHAAEQDLGDNDLDAARTFGDTLTTLMGVTEETMAGVEQMIKAIEPLEEMSRDMRLPLRKLRSGLTSLVHARELTSEWAELAEAHGFRSEVDDQT